jgi:thiamine biosynthesis lipoprotein
VLSSGRRADLDREIRDTLTRIEALMSTWDPESELSRFNRSAGTDPFAVAPETVEVFRWAVTLGEESGGALDVTVSPIVEAWGFGAAAAASPPAPGAEAIARLLEATGLRHLELDPDGKWVRKRRPDVQCDFSALAPGYAADRLGALLAERGLADFLVDVGGELVARGRNAGGAAWQIAIERPGTGPRRIARVVPLRDVAIATSGDYRNYREVNGARVSHVIDPRSGRPITHRLASVTVVDRLAVRADALATALMVLGPDEGLALARRLDLAALLMVRTDTGGFDEIMTPRFTALLKD